MSEKPKPAFRKRRPFPRTLAECVDPVTKPSFKEFGFAETRILKDWAHIVGPHLAGFTAPVAIRKAQGDKPGVLTIAVTGAFALECQHMEPVILETLASFFGYRAIHRIQLKQVASIGDTAKKKRYTKPLPADATLETALKRLEEALHSPT